LEEAMVAAKGVTAAVDWQASSNKNSNKGINLRMIINSNSKVRRLHHP
jgi:hypothetical protein